LAKGWNQKERGGEKPEAKKKTNLSFIDKGKGERERRQRMKGSREKNAITRLLKVPLEDTGKGENA